MKISVYGSTSGSSGYLLYFYIDDYPPEIINEYPEDGQKFVPITQNLIYFDVVDEYRGNEEFGVKLETIDAYVDGYWAFKNGEFQYPFTGPDSYFSSVAFDDYEGYSFIFDYEYLWEADKQIDLRIIAEDLLGNPMDETWSFYTPEFIPPVFRNFDPASGETIVSIDREIIEFDILSTTYTKIVGNSIDAYVNNVLGFDNETFNAPFDGGDAYYGSLFTIEGYDGYKIKLDYTNTPWNSYELVSVRLRAQDAYGFWANEEYTFRIQDTEGPIFTNAYPDPGMGFFKEDTLIWVDFYDVGSGIDAYSIDAYVDNIHVYDGYNFTTGFDGPSSALTAKTFDSYDGYRLTIDKTGYFESGETVPVRVYVRDREGN